MPIRGPAAGAPPRSSICRRGSARWRCCSKGCTACYDLAAEIPAPSVEGLNAVARAYHDVGLRAVIAPMMADTTFYRAIPGLIAAMPTELREKAEAIRATPYDVSLAICRTVIENWAWDRDRLRPALAPTIPHHCTDDFIVACRDLAKAHGIGVQMHVAESKVQALVGPRKYDTTLVGHLHKLGMIGAELHRRACDLDRR